MMSGRVVAIGLALVAAGLGCLDVADERAVREESIGLAEAGGVRWTVEDNLAAIPRIVPGEVALWAQAPSLSIEVETGLGGDWSVSIANVLPEAELRVAQAEGGAAVPVTFAGAPRPTEKQWTISLPAGETVNLSLASPGASQVAPWRFVVFADVQDAIDEVQDLFRRINEVPGVELCLISGDLTERGTSAEILRFQDEMRSLRVPCYATLGNHELGADPPPFHALFGPGSFSFVHRGTRFTLLDSASATIAPRVYERLDRWLALGEDSMHVAMMHIPPLDPRGLRNGAFANRQEAAALVQRFAEAAVDLTIYGHVHSFYAYSNAGIPAYITGGGGAIPERLDGIERHFLVIDVDPASQAFSTAIVRVD